MQNQISIEVIRYYIPEEKHAAFEKAYADAGIFLKASPYFLGYQVIRGEEEPEHYMVIIHWISTEDHINGFRNSEQFGAFFNLVKPYFGYIKEMKHYKDINIGQ